jgi:Macrocin-O-methyltransferase (TylF)
MSTEPDTKLQSRASPEQRGAREKLRDLYTSTPIPTDQLLVNLGLYMRSSVLAKLLYVNELYQLILDLPGVVMEFGVWWGQNLALVESLRAVYEPYNHMRKVIGFDTFTGYPEVSSEDGSHELAAAGQYAVGEGYIDHLRAVLDYHEEENVMAHVPKYELVAGDATKSIGDYLERNPHTLIALAYFDMQLYEPTRACLEAIRPHLVRGAVVALDELGSDEFPGETRALRETLGIDRYQLRRSRFLPDRTYLVID